MSTTSNAIARAPRGRTRTVAGWVCSWLVVLFLLFDAAIKLPPIQPVTDMRRAPNSRVRVMERNLAQMSGNAPSTNDCVAASAEAIERTQEKRPRAEARGPFARRLFGG